MAEPSSNNEIGTKLPIQDQQQLSSLDLLNQVNRLLLIANQEKGQNALRDRLMEEAEACRKNARERSGEPPKEYYSRMTELHASAEEARQEAFKLREKTTRKLLNITEPLTNSSSFRNNFNPYERFILTHSVDVLRKYPYSQIQDISLNVLSLSVRGEHVTEKEAVEQALATKRKEYKDLSSKESKHYPDDPLHELFYAIKECPSLVYSESGINQNLIRRVVALESETIRNLAYAKIPQEYTINRAYIDSMLKLCASGDYPEWSGERFLDKIQSHTENPYSDEDFRTKAPILRSKAETLAKQLPTLIPSAIAVGISGSLARPGFFGFNPNTSDIDLVVYNHGWPYEIKKISSTVQGFIEQGNPICTDATMDDGMGNLQLPWSLTTTKEIEGITSACSPEDPFFDRFAFLASFHNETLISHINDPKTFEDKINNPLQTFYKTQLAPLQKHTRELFAQLDGV